MPTSRDVVEHVDAVKATAFATGVPAEQIDGYLIVAYTTADAFVITSNATTKAATVALMAAALDDLARALADDLAGLMIG